MLMMNLNPFDIRESRPRTGVVAGSGATVVEGEVVLVVEGVVVVVVVGAAPIASELLAASDPADPGVGSVNVAWFDDRSVMFPPLPESALVDT